MEHGRTWENVNKDGSSRLVSFDKKKPPEKIFTKWSCCAVLEKHRSSIKRSAFLASNSFVSRVEMCCKLLESLYDKKIGLLKGGSSTSTNTRSAQRMLSIKNVSVTKDTNDLTFTLRKANHAIHQNLSTKSKEGTIVQLIKMKRETMHLFALVRKCCTRASCILSNNKP